MSSASFTLSVRDERGKAQRGVITFVGRAPRRPPEAPATFQIALLTSASPPRSVPAVTAVCVPKLARGSIVRRGDAPANAAGEISALKRGSMSEARHAQYRAGAILLPSGTLEASKVFQRGAKVDFEHLALLLVDMQRAETLAPYLAIIRHELGEPPSANALLALETRLSPANSDERPPARAPGIVRLRRALRCLEGAMEPELTLDELTADLRFLRLFERTDHLLRRGALDRLLSELASPPAAKSTPAHRPAARIIRLPRRGRA